MRIPGAPIRISDEKIATIAESLLMGMTVEEAAHRAFMEERKYDQATWLRVTQQIRDQMPKHIPQVKALHKARIGKIVALLIISLVLVLVNVITALFGSFVYVALAIMCVSLFFIASAKYFQLAKRRDEMLEAAERWGKEPEGQS